MTQYIDKSALVAEIKGYISNYKEIVAKINRNDSTWVDSVSMIESKIGVLQHLLAFLDTLEVKEVQEKPISEELEEAANSCSSCIYLEEVLSDDDKEVLKARLLNTFKAGYKFGKEQAEIQIKAQSMALAHGCPKEPVGEDLEEAARKIATRHSHITGDTYYANDAWFFKKGAQWQKEQILGDDNKQYHRLRHETLKRLYENEAKLKLMLDNSLEGYIEKYEQIGGHNYLSLKIPMLSKPDDCKDGDKIKLIILKEE